MNRILMSLVLALASVMAHAVEPELAPAPATAPVTALDAESAGRIYFNSFSVPDFQALRYPQREPVVVHGTLKMPVVADGQKVPAVIIVHGSDGVLRKDFRVWADTLNAAGIAAFVIDTYTGRGVRDTYTGNFFSVSVASQTVDALKALDLLATHPRIDAKRIAIMGFSRGASVAYLTWINRFAEAVTTRKFVAHIPLYFSCSSAIVDSRNRNDAPVLMLNGDADDWTPNEHCADLVRKYYPKAGFKLVTYPGAGHGFDALGPYHEFRAQSMTDCTTETDVAYGTSVNWKTGQQYRGNELQEYLRACMTPATRHAGGHPESRERAKADVLSFLAATFGSIQ